MAAVFPDDLVGACLSDLLDGARAVRARGTGKLVTFSPKVFIPLTKLCRDLCPLLHVRVGLTLIRATHEDATADGTEGKKGVSNGRGSESLTDQVIERRCRL